VLALTAAGAGALALVVPWGPPAPARAVAPAPGVPAVNLEDGGTHRSPPPAEVRIPAVGIAGPVDPVGLDTAGSLVPPEDTARAGWFAGGPAPGDVGPAVIVGHVDSYRGPGVFFRLRDLRPGDDIEVRRADGSAVHFAVTRVARYPKTAFPTAAVYGSTPDAELRLVTCGGAFDRAARSYLDNVVVYARLG